MKFYNLTIYYDKINSNIIMLGYHVNIIKKSFQKSIELAHKNSKIDAFQLFVRNPRALKIVEYNEKEASLCKSYVEKNNFFLVVHATYLLNSATKDDFEHKINSSINDLIYAEKIGAIGSIFHVGKYLKQSPQQGIENMYHFISTVIEKLQLLDSKSIYILETCAKCGTELLSDLEEFGNFYHRFTDKQKENFKICIDTCHVFSANYSLKSEKNAISFIDIVDKFIGWKNVIVIHLNDSKKDCGCCVDRHENLCKGYIGKDDESGFKYFVNHCYELKIPLILETPHEDHDIYDIHNGEIEKIKTWLR